MGILRTYLLLVIGLLLLLVSGGVSADKSEQGKASVLIWGDSLSAAYGMDVQQGWVALMRQRLEPQGIAVVNGSISGETTLGGLTRLPRALEKHQPNLVVLELGANDGLRGLSVAKMRENLQAMIDLSRGAGAEVLLLGMHIPPNYGLQYARQFAEVFEELEAINGIERVPFFLEGVSEDRSLMQFDNLHPNEKAQPIILENVWPSLSPLIERVI